MKPLIMALTLMPLLFNLEACNKKTASGSRSPQAEEQCKANPDYIWRNDHCLAKNSLLNRQAECKEKGDNFLWINNECVEKEAMLAPKSRCEEKDDGSYWHIDPNTGQGSCIGPTRIVTAKEECEAQEGHLWDHTHQQCLDSEGQACNKGGDIWVDQQCLTQPLYQARKECLDRSDGSKWQNLRCISLAEQRCYERGFDFTWKEQPEPGVCLPKTFYDYCHDPAAPADLRHTVNAILALGDVPDKDCKAAAESLSIKQSLRLSGRRIKDLRPFYGLENLKVLDLQNNDISNLEVLKSLSRLEELNLSENQIVDLKALTGLRFLQVLYLADNQVKELAPLAGLPSLQKLYLDHNKISNANALAQVDANLNGGLDKLIELSLADNCGITDISDLVRFTQLRYLSLKLTGISKENLPAFPSSTMVDHSSCP